MKLINVFEKLDGTNVLAYRYRDADGVFHATYKLRLWPVLRNGRFGRFLDMWKEMTAKHPAIAKVAEVNDCAVGFELYGARNAHLVLYDVPLACAVLFGVAPDGTVIPPTLLDTLDLPTVPHHGTLEAGKNPVSEYSRIRAELEGGLEQLEDEHYRGSEGTV